MIGLADENGKTYECKYATYNKEDGFKFFGDEHKKVIHDLGWRGMVNTLFHDDLWKLKENPVKKMTLQDIERELGYRVRIVDSEPDKKPSKSKRKEIDEYLNTMERLFGLNFKNREDYY